MAGEYAPKKLKDIVLRPSRKWSEYDGNTDDEKDIVRKSRASTVVHPDRNGNEDDVFKASKLKRAGKPVAPGEDEKKYADNNGHVTNVGEDVEQLDEIGDTRRGQSALRNYMRVAAKKFVKHDDAGDSFRDIADKFKDPKNKKAAIEKAGKQYWKADTHMIGMQRAGKRIKEDVELDELNSDREGYYRKAQVEVGKHVGTKKFVNRIVGLNRAAKAKPRGKPAPLGEEVESLDEGKMLSHMSAKISGWEMDHHWATKHVAPFGSYIRSHGRDAVITHPDGSVHHIEDGAVHCCDMKYGEKPEGKTHAHAGKFNVAMVTDHYGKVHERKVSFVGQKKAGRFIGNHTTTEDESRAKEFHNETHARNYAHYMNSITDVVGHRGHPTRFVPTPKRDPQQIKKAKAEYGAAKKAHQDTLSKNGFNISHPDVVKSYVNMQSKRHPAYNS
jgi:hypothetical protein